MARPSTPISPGFRHCLQRWLRPATRLLLFRRRLLGPRVAAAAASSLPQRATPSPSGRPGSASSQGLHRLCLQQRPKPRQPAGRPTTTRLLRRLPGRWGRPLINAPRLWRTPPPAARGRIPTPRRRRRPAPEGAAGTPMETSMCRALMWRSRGGSSELSRGGGRRPTRGAPVAPRHSRLRPQLGWRRSPRPPASGGWRSVPAAAAAVSAPRKRRGAMPSRPLVPGRASSGASPLCSTRRPAGAPPTAERHGRGQPRPPPPLLSPWSRCCRLRGDGFSTELVEDGHRAPAGATLQGCEEAVWRSFGWGLCHGAGAA
mmetsp:Transcript_22180/g.61542  ORF Transcript_22180/g.61542 Transcript_22180/m.61542 type:complete len:315 (-) Transcript_22180:102-1046(-)